jgi:hypothetical protein
MPARAVHRNSRAGDKSAGTGQLGQDSWYRIDGTGQPGQSIRVGIGHLVEDNWNRTGQSRQVSTTGHD